MGSFSSSVDIDDPFKEDKVELNFLDTSIKKLDKKKSLPKIVVPLALYPLHLRGGKNLISGEFL